MYSRQSYLYLLTISISALIGLSGCNRRTPEERLQKAVEFIKQNDTLSAEVEAKKVVEQNPDDPMAIQARMLLAQIYARDQRFDEARAELEPALDKVSQKDVLGKRLLQAYLVVLRQDKKFDEALKTIDRFQQKYSNDEATSLDLTVARADMQTAAGETTAARVALLQLHESTTSPAEQDLYRGMIVSTYQRERNTTGAIQYIESEVAAAKRDDVKRGLAQQLAEMYAASQNYEKTREYATMATELFDSATSSQLDARNQAGQMFDLARVYVTIGNLSGARVAFQALFDSAPQEPQLIMATVAGLTEALVRQGQPDAAIGFLKEAAGRYPTAPFAQQAAQIEALKQQGRLADYVDTSTLAMRFKSDALLTPKNLPKPSLTTGTLSAASRATSGTAGSAPTTATEVSAASTTTTTDTKQTSGT